jgi:hypothetical protein
MAAIYIGEYNDEYLSEAFGIVALEVADWTWLLATTSRTRSIRYLELMCEWQYIQVLAGVCGVGGWMLVGEANNT